MKRHYSQGLWERYHTAIIIALSSVASATSPLIPSMAAQTAPAEDAGSSCNWTAKDVFASERFTVRQNLDRAQLPKAAFLEYVKPSHDSSSSQIGLGIRYNFPCGGSFEGGPFVEVLQNTLSTAKQNVLRYGLSAEWMMWDIGGVSTSGQAISGGHGWTPDWTGRLGGKRDRVEESTAIQANLFLTPVFRGHAKNPRYFFLPNVISRFGSRALPLFDFSYAPALGIEYEAGVSSKDSKSTNTGRLSTDVAVEIYPLPAMLDSRAFVRAQYQFRQDLWRSGLTGSKSHGWFEASTGYYFIGRADASQSAGIEIAYTHGENPDESFVKQEVVSIRLVLRRTP